MLGLSDNLTKTVFVCIFVLGFVYLGVRHVGTLFLRSLYDILFQKYITSWVFSGFSCSRAISGLGWIGMGWDLCVGLLYEHRFAVLIRPNMIIRYVD